MLRSGLTAFRPVARPFRTHVPSRAYRQQRFGDAHPRRQFIGGFFLRWAARPTFYRDIGIITAGTGGFYLYNLEEVPVRTLKAVRRTNVTWISAVDQC